MKTFTWIYQYIWGKPEPSQKKKKSQITLQSEVFRTVTNTSTLTKWSFPLKSHSIPVSISTMPYIFPHFRKSFLKEATASVLSWKKRGELERVGHPASTVSQEGILAFLQTLLLISFFIPVLQLYAFLLIQVLLLRDTNKKCCEHSINKKYPSTPYVIPLQKTVQVKQCFSAPCSFLRPKSMPCMQN